MPGGRESATLPYPSPMHYLLFYDYVDDMLAKRDPVRPAHLELVRAWHERGALKMAGAMTDPLDGAVFVFTCDSPSDIDAFVAADPYVANNLVTGWRVRPWNVVVG